MPNNPPSRGTAASAPSHATRKGRLAAARALVTRFRQRNGRPGETDEGCGSDADGAAGQGPECGPERGPGSGQGLGGCVRPQTGREGRLLRRRTVYAVALTVLVLASTCVLAYESALRLVRHNHDVIRAQSAVLELEGAQTALAGVDSGARLFLYTGRSEDLALYHTTTVDLRAHLARLAALAPSPDALSPFIPLVRGAMDSYLALADGAARRRVSSEPVRPGAALDMGLESRRATALICLRQTVAAGRSVLEERRAAREGGLRRLLGSVAVLGLLNALLLHIVVRLTRGDIRQRLRAEERLRASERQFRSVIGSANDAIIGMDARNCITFWNRAAEAIFGYSPDEALGRPVRILMPERYRGRHKRGVEGLRRSHVRGDGRVLELHGLRKDGVEFPVELSLGAWETEAGFFYCGIVRDITERRLAEAAMREKEERFRSIFENATIGLYRTSPEGDILMCNPALLRMLGYETFEELARHNLEREPVGASQATRRRFLDLMERYGEVRGMEAEWHRRDGSPITMRESARVVRDVADGRVLYYEGTLEDVTERRQTEAQLQRYQVLVKHTTDAMLFIHPSGRILEANAAAVRTYGYSREEFAALTISSLRVAESDEDIRQTLLAARSRGVLFEARHRRKDGSDFPVEVSSQSALLDGELVLLSVVRDVSERKRAEEALRQSESTMRSFYDSASMLMGIVELRDDDFVFVDGNAAAARIYGMTVEGMRGRRASELGLSHEGIAMWIARYRESEARGEPVRFEFAQDNDPISGWNPAAGWSSAVGWSSATVCAIQGTGDAARFSYIVEDITERKRAEEALRLANSKLSVLAMHDGLTGLKNYRAFEERLREEMQRAIRYDAPLSILLIDIDHFKRFNDTFGHLAGDEALRRVAEVLERLGREADLPARYGGEEFVIILPSTDAEGARALAERLCRAVEASAPAERLVTVSVGATTLSPAVSDLATFISEADTALYASKRAGRNHATHAWDLPADERTALASAPKIAIPFGAALPTRCEE